MAKGIELYYSRQKSDFIEGRAYSNPRFFSGPRQGVTKVYLDGDWPKIEAAYRTLGVPVERIDPEAMVAVDKKAPPPGVKSIVPTIPEDERSAIYIPDDWRDLGWTKPTEGRDITLRGLAAMFSAEPVLNKAQATAAIEAELERRTNAEPAASNGLTRREMNADLEVAGVEIEPALDIEALAVRHAEVKAA